MAEIKISQSAINDINELTEYISRDSPIYALAFGDRIFERIMQLETFPQLGRIVPEFSDESIRELILGSYRIVYKLYNTEIIVIRVIHGSKLLL